MLSREISESLFKIFSKDGLELKGFKIKVKSPMIATVKHEDNEVKIVFDENLPRAEVKKFITFYAYVEQIVFGENGGSIRLKNFPDLHFGYDSNGISSVIQATLFSEDFEMERLIDATYQEGTRRKIARDALHYAKHWATIVSQVGVFSELDESEKKYTGRELKAQCYSFVVENLRRNNDEGRYGSAILTYILVFIIIPAIAKFIVNKLLEKYL